MLSHESRRHGCRERGEVIVYRDGLSLSAPAGRFIELLDELRDSTHDLPAGIH